MAGFGSASTLPFAGSPGASAATPPFAGFAGSGQVAGEGSPAMVIPSVTATPSGNPFVAPGGPGATQEIARMARGAPPQPNITVGTTVFQAAAAQGKIPGLSEFMDGLEAPEDTLCATLCHVAESDMTHALESILVNRRVLEPIPSGQACGLHPFYLLRV